MTIIPEQNLVIWDAYFRILNLIKRGIQLQNPFLGHQNFLWSSQIKQFYSLKFDRLIRNGACVYMCYWATKFNLQSSICDLISNIKRERETLHILAITKCMLHVAPMNNCGKNEEKHNKANFFKHMLKLKGEGSYSPSRNENYIWLEPLSTWHNDFIKHGPHGNVTWASWQW